VALPAESEATEAAPEFAEFTEFTNAGMEDFSFKNEKTTLSTLKIISDASTA
jgi:hypothetical protein